MPTFWETREHFGGVILPPGSPWMGRSMTPRGRHGMRAHIGTSAHSPRHEPTAAGHAICGSRGRAIYSAAAARCAIRCSR
jgi:hypothetical protein